MQLYEHMVTLGNGEHWRTVEGLFGEPFSMMSHNYRVHIECFLDQLSSACVGGMIMATVKKAPLDPSTALGGLWKNYSKASAFLIIYHVNNAINKEGNETERAVAWEKAFLELAKDELLQMVPPKT